MNDFNFKKAEDIKEPECFYILFERRSEGLGASPGHFNVGKPVEVLQQGCGKERCVGCGEVWVGVWESVWGEWESVLACGDRNGGGVGKCVWVWDLNTLPHISSLTSLPSPFPKSTLTSPTPQHTFLHFFSYLFPHHFFLPQTHFPTIPP